jgi:hypothetical protein
MVGYKYLLYMLLNNLRKQKLSSNFDMAVLMLSYQESYFLCYIIYYIARAIDLIGQDWKWNNSHKVRILRPGQTGLWKRKRYIKTAIGFSHSSAARDL